MIPSNAFVCLLGLGIVFIGLFCIILLCHIVHFTCDIVATYLTQTSKHNISHSSNNPSSNSKN